MTRIGIDLGGSGSRIATSDGVVAAGPPFAVRDARAGHADVIRLLDAALPTERRSVDAIAVCAAGLVSLGDVGEIRDAIAAQWPAASVVIASDAIGGIAAVWGRAGGAVVAAGTGAIGFATDFAEMWVRSDGWGDTFGDDGGAAWIGRHGMAAALRAIDDRPGASVVLLESLRASGRDPFALPEEVRGSPNRASLLASFAPAVTEAATSDEVARSIVEAAAEHLAETGLSLVRRTRVERLALVGGLAAVPAIAEAFEARVRQRMPEVGVLIGTASPLDGALRLAELVAGGALRSRAPYLHVLPPRIQKEPEGAS